MTIVCPKCNKSIAASAVNAGEEFRCPECQGIVDVPLVENEPAATKVSAIVPPPLPVPSQVVLWAESVVDDDMVAQATSGKQNPYAASQIQIPKRALWQSAGLGRFISEAALETMSHPLVAVATTVGIVGISIILFVAERIDVFIPLVCASALAIYFDATDNKIGQIPPRKWFSANISAGTWAWSVYIFWLFYFPIYLIKRPVLLEKARISPQVSRWKSLVVGLLTALFIAVTIGTIVRGTHIALSTIESEVKELLQKESGKAIAEVSLLKDGDRDSPKYTGIATAKDGTKYDLVVTVDEKNGRLMMEYVRQGRWKW